jgi:hypothetical protein
MKKASTVVRVKLVEKMEAIMQGSWAKIDRMNGYLLP